MSSETLHIMAATETAQASPENHPSPGDMELVPERLPENQARKERKAAVDLPRDKDDAVCEVMEPPEGDLSEEEELLWECFGGNILNEFPEWKQKQEETIRKLRALADKVNATREKTSIINMAANCTAVLSEFMSLAGVVLAPVTAGGSLTLTAAGQSLGVAAGITSVVSNLIEESGNEHVQAQANSLEPTSEPESEQVDREESTYVKALTEIISKVGETSRFLKKIRRSYKAARAKSSLVKAVKNLLKGDQDSTQIIRHLGKASDGTPLAKTLLKGGGMAAANLAWDSYNHSEGWKKLKDGERAQLAEDLRARAQELEEEVIRYSQCFERLRQKFLNL